MLLAKTTLAEAGPVMVEVNVISVIIVLLVSLVMLSSLALIFWRLHAQDAILGPNALQAMTMVVIVPIIFFLALAGRLSIEVTGILLAMIAGFLLARTLPPNEE